MDVKVLEFNKRFGDPEIVVLLARMKSDLVDPTGRRPSTARSPEKISSWAIAPPSAWWLAPGGYPGDYAKGKPITGLEQFFFRERRRRTVFHAGTKLENGRVVTAGGRVLGVTALGSDFPRRAGASPRLRGRARHSSSRAANTAPTLPKRVCCSVRVLPSQRESDPLRHSLPRFRFHFTGLARAIAFAGPARHVGCARGDRQPLAIRPQRRDQQTQIQLR